MAQKSGAARRFSWRSLTPQLFLFVVLPLTIVLIAVTVGGLRLHQQAMRGLVGDRDLRAVLAATSALGEQIHHRRDAIRGLALRAEQVESPAQLDSILGEYGFLSTDFDGGLAFFNPQGQLLASQGYQALWETMASTSNQELSLVLDANQPLLLQLPGLAGNGELVFVSSAASDNQVIAVGAFSPTHMIQTALADLIISQDGSAAFVVSGDRRLLYVSGHLADVEDVSQYAGVSQALAGESGATFLQVNGSEHVVAFAPVPVVGWVLVLEEPWETVASPTLRLTEDVPLVLIPVVILAVVALWFATRHVVQPIQKLESQARQLAWGDFSAIEEPVEGISEIQHLQSELIDMARKVRASQESLKGYIGAITRGQEEERRRLARELHDDTLQALIALNQRVQLARMSLDGSPQAEESLAEIQTLTEATIRDLRRVTGGLRPAYLEELGLVSALQMLAQEVQRAQGLEVDFQISGREERLAPQVELALYRIAQEALSNVGRHAEAKQASLSLTFRSGELLMDIRDDGKGFQVPESPAEFAPSGHFGLLGMHERAEMIGASLKIHSQPGQGTHLSIFVPGARTRPD
jgi:two-component system sensor histidine kinase UhpB